MTPELEPEWLLVIAGGGRSGVRGLAALPGGGAVAVGGFDGELAAGAVRLASAGAGDGFALGLSRSGAVAWSIGLSGPADQEMTAAAAAPDGSIALAGTTSGPARLSGRAPRSIEGRGQPAALIARADGRGQVRWQRPIAASGYAVPTALTWTADGDVVVAGYFAGSLCSDPGPCPPGGRPGVERETAALAAAGSLDLWVARLAGGDGRVVWIHRAGGPGADAARAVIASAGVALVAGSFQRWVDFSSTTLRSGDRDADGFVAAVGPDGFASARSMAGDGAAVVQALAAAPGGRLAAAISFDGSLDVKGRSIEAGQGSGGLVLLLDAAGEPLWARVVDGAGSASGVAIAGGAILVAGEASGSGGYLAALSPAGRLLWTRPLGHAVPSALAAGDGGALVGGSIDGRLTLGRFDVAVAGESDGFVARFPR